MGKPIFVEQEQDQPLHEDFDSHKLIQRATDDRRKQYVNGLDAKNEAYLAGYLRKRKKFKEALINFQRSYAIAKHGDNPKPLEDVDAALCLKQLDKPGEALRTLNKVIRDYPRDSYAYQTKVELVEDLERYNEAVCTWNKIVSNADYLFDNLF